MSNKPQTEAQARYDARRRAPMTGRLTPEQQDWLNARRLPGESQFKALKRLAGLPGTTNPRGTKP